MLLTIRHVQYESGTNYSQLCSVNLTCAFVCDCAVQPVQASSGLHEPTGVELSDVMRSYLQADAHCAYELHGPEYQCGRHDRHSNGSMTSSSDGSTGTASSNSAMLWIEGCNLRTVAGTDTVEGGTKAKASARLYTSVLLRTCSLPPLRLLFYYFLMRCGQVEDKYLSNTVQYSGLHVQVLEGLWEVRCIQWLVCTVPYYVVTRSNRVSRQGSI